MIYIASDHRGFLLKEDLKQKLQQSGFIVKDLGNDHLDPDDDYVDYAKKVALEIVTDQDDSRGILLCGSGVGMDIVANKIDNIRCALVCDVAGAKQAREHEDANVISLAADKLDKNQAYEIIMTFLNTPFSNQARHIRRLKKLSQVEEEDA